MRRWMVTALALAAIGCASSGPAPLGDSSDDVRTAQQMIEAAQAAGADTVPGATTELAAAKSAYAEATQAGSSQNWASLKAREASAKAAYARALAEKAQAQQKQQDARASLSQMPPGGAR